MRYLVTHRSAATRPGLTQVLGSGPKSSCCVFSQPDRPRLFQHSLAAETVDQVFGDNGSKVLAWVTESGTDFGRSSTDRSPMLVCME